ncbi:MAG: hypothetical protein ACFCU4_09330 [Puniceicoccaceae bacterium]
MKSNISKTLRHLALLGLATSAANAAILFDDFSVDSSASYNQTRDPLTYDGVGLGVGGVAGRYATPLAGNLNYAAANTNSFGSFNDELEYTASVYFLTTSTLGTIGGTNLAGVGITRDNTQLFDGGAIGQIYVEARTTNSGPADSTTQRQANLRLRNNDSSASQQLSSTFDLLANNWYEISLTVASLGSNQYSVSSEIFAWGTDGVTGGLSIGSTSPFTFTNDQIAESDALFAGLRGRGVNDEGTVALDNLTVVPEPSAGAIWLGLFSVTFLLARRRR